MPASILIADDDGVSRKLLQRLLEQDGHDVRAAADGREALDLFRAEPSDVVLLDIVMPELDGISVLEQLKATPGAVDVPVIMISAVDETDSVVRCIEIGADDYLPKPFNPVILRARINAGLAKKRLHELERERVRETFSRFVPEPVVDEVLQRTDDDLRLPGVRVAGTVMFSDLRAFTTFAETTPAHEVIEVLNDYLTEMSDAILDNGGTLVAYMGDGIMAVFGAPIEAEDHADRALTAAREMLRKRLPRFNRWLGKNGFQHDFRMGIGLSSGPLMSGTVGSSRRLEYAAIGDTTNTASRLESMTKQTSHSILISEATRRLLRQPPNDLVFVDEVEVPGKRSKIKLWTLSDASADDEGSTRSRGQSSCTPLRYP